MVGSSSRWLVCDRIHQQLSRGYGFSSVTTFLRDAVELVWLAVDVMLMVIHELRGSESRDFRQRSTSNETEHGKIPAVMFSGVGASQRRTLSTTETRCADIPITPTTTIVVAVALHFHGMSLFVTDPQNTLLIADLLHTQHSPLSTTNRYDEIRETAVVVVVVAIESFVASSRVALVATHNSPS